MSLHPTFRFLLASALTAVAAPAWPQSYLHAPPTPPGGDALLPVIMPGTPSRGGRLRTPFEGWEAPPRAAESRPTVSRPAAAAPASSPAAPQDVRTASSAPRPVWVPPHVGANHWVRLPEPEPVAAATAPTVSVAGGSLPTIMPRHPAPARTGPAGPDREAVALSDADRARGLAAEAIARGDGAAAAKILAEAAERSPSDPRLVAALARAREAQGDWIGAIIAYDVLEKLEPSEPRWRARRAECRYHAGQFARSAEDFRSAAAAAPLTFDEYARFGDAALRAGDPATADEALAALARLGGKPLPQVELLRGFAALRQGKADEARAILLKASARWPQDAAITEALRLAASVHYGDRPASAAANVALPSVAVPKAVAARTAPAVTDVATADGATPAPGEPTIVETAAVGPDEQAPAALPRADEQAPAALPRADAEPMPVIGQWRRSRPRPEAEPAPEVAAFDAAFEATATPEEADEATSDGWRAAEPKRLDVPAAPGDEPKLLEVPEEDQATDAGPHPLPVEAPR